jgi:hypothetical protein
VGEYRTTSESTDLKWTCIYLCLIVPRHRRRSCQAGSEVLLKHQEVMGFAVFCRSLTTGQATQLLEAVDCFLLIGLAACCRRWWNRGSLIFHYRGLSRLRRIDGLRMHSLLQLRFRDCRSSLGCGYITKDLRRVSGKMPIIRG